MATTEILPFAIDGGANVITQGAYDALAARDTGFVAGIATSAQLNKVWRQSSFMSAALANFLVDQGISQPDDGDVPAAVTNIEDALTAFMGNTAANIVNGGTTGGTANVQTATATGFTLAAGNGIVAKIGVTNTGAMTLNVNGTGAKNVYHQTASGPAAVTSGQAVINNIGLFIYDGTQYQLIQQSFGALSFLGIGDGLRQVGSNLAADWLQGVSTSTSAAQDITSTIPYDDTIPQNTEGDEVITLAITPKSSANKLRIKVHLYVGGDTPETMAIMALFQDSTVNALTASVVAIPDNGVSNSGELIYEMVAGTTSATTFKLRVGIGPSAGGTLTVNGVPSGQRLFGATPKTTMEITEILA